MDVTGHGQILNLYISLACPSAYLRDREVYAERGIFVFQLTCQVINALAKHFWGIHHPANDTDSTCKWPVCEYGVTWNI